MEPTQTPGKEAAPRSPERRTGERRVPPIIDQPERSVGQSGRRSTRIGGLFEAISRGEHFSPAIDPAVAEDDPLLEIERFDLWYGKSQALFDIGFDVPRGKVTALIGPSGCGKSTLLRSVNRMNDLVDGVRIDGQMRLNGDEIYAPGVDVIELRKRIGMVFQKPNPFPMSIYENVVYSLRIDGENDRRVLDDVPAK